MSESAMSQNTFPLTINHYGEVYYTQLAMNLMNDLLKKRDKELANLKEQNKKLKECVVFYSKATDNPKKYMRQGYEVYNLKKAIFIDGGDLARKCLEEIDHDQNNSIYN